MFIVFWLALALVAYTLALYPFLLWLVSLVRRRVHRQGDIAPVVSVIIVAHNAAETIAAKIENTLAWDYPREKLEILVGSDGSTDATCEVVRSFAGRGVRLVESTERRGKHHLQMVAREVARGEILVFTDVAIRADPPLLGKMLSHFADPSVGAVSSVDYIPDAHKSWIGEHLYVCGEMGLRRLEARVSSLVSLSGSLFSVRRALCESWHADQSSDFFLALHVVERGKRAVIALECPASFGVVRSERGELERKVRTIVHGLVVFFAHGKLVNPFRYGLFSWQLVSHKLFRWILPFGLIALLVSNVSLWWAGPFYQLLLALQLLGYGTGIAAYFLGGKFEAGVLRLAGFFFLGNVATLVAWWKFCLGEKMVTWEPSQRD